MKFFDELQKEVYRTEKQKKPCDKPYQYIDRLSKDVKDTLDDIDNNKNHSWSVELFKKNDIENDFNPGEDIFDKEALFYRGNKISLGEYFDNSFEFAKSLKQMGFKKGDKIPVCITNIPEFVYLMTAASFIGAIIEPVQDWFDPNYLKEIIKDSNSKTFFIDDISYENIKDTLDESDIDNLVMFSITDSFLKDKDGNKYNPYKAIDDKFHKMDDRVEEFMKISKQNFYNLEDFKELGKNYSGEVVELVDLNDPYSITFTSGTTSPGRPKGVIHSNRCYLTLGTFFEKDNSNLKGFSYLGHIPTDTHMALSCGVIDTLLCGCIYDCEPFYDKDFFLYSLMINKPNFVPASNGFWGSACKLLNFDPEWKNVKMPFLAVPLISGEGASQGEEKFYNITSRKHSFGTDKFPRPITPSTFSIGGGTTEGTGVLITVFKGLLEKLPNNAVKKEGLGLTPMSFATVDVVDENGKYCKMYEPGLLVEKSPCEMMGYTNPEFNKGTKIVAEDGEEWLSLGTYSYKSDSKRIKMKGRMNDNCILEDGKKFPLYLIEDAVLKDTKNIMSCAVVSINNDEDLVCHIEAQPLTKTSKGKIYRGIAERLRKFVPEEVLDKLFIRIRKEFPLDPSGKRSISTLKETGIDKFTYPYAYFDGKVHEVKNKNVKTLGLRKQK